MQLVINNICVIKENTPALKSGGGIHIKKKNRGKFTEYCGGKVTDSCIRRAKASGNSTLKKRAIFAENARKWKHDYGGNLAYISYESPDIQSFENNQETVLENTYETPAKKSKSKFDINAEAFYKKAKPMFQELRRRGIKLSRAALAGILGNIALESGFRHNASNGSHYGYLQNDSNIQKFIKSRYGGMDHNHQMQYLVDGLSGRLAAFNKGLHSRFNNFLTAVQKVKDPRVAAHLWEKYYELSGGQGNNLRSDYAKYIYDRLVEEGLAFDNTQPNDLSIPVLENYYG